MKLNRIIGIKKKIKDNKIKVYFLGIPFWKIILQNTRIKIYFLGLRILSVPKPFEKNIHSPQNEKQVMLKAFELFNYGRDYNKAKVK